MTIFLGVVLVLLAWLLISGIEGKREIAALSPPAATPGTGAVLVIGGTRASGLEVVRLLRARGDEVAVLVRPESDGSAAEQLGARVVRGDAMNQPDIAAALADKMVMRRHVGLEPRAVSDNAEPFRKADFLERAQRSVHSVEGHGRQTADDALVEHLRAWMVAGTRQLAIDLLPLRGDSQPNLPAPCAKRGESGVDSCGVNLPGVHWRRNSVFICRTTQVYYSRLR